MCLKLKVNREQELIQIQEKCFRFKSRCLIMFLCLLDWVTRSYKCYMIPPFPCMRWRDNDFWWSTIDPWIFSFHFFLSLACFKFSIFLLFSSSRIFLLLLNWIFCLVFRLTIKIFISFVSLFFRGGKKCCHLVVWLTFFWIRLHKLKTETVLIWMI